MNNPGLIFLGCIVGFFAWFVVRCLGRGLFTVDQNERAVKTSFGRAERVGAATTLDDPIAKALKDEERQRYCYPQVRVIHPGGPYFKWPWEEVHKVVIATQTMNMAYDPETPTANTMGTVLEAVTKDQLNTGLKGQIRYRISERNLYAYLFGVKHPIAHVMGYFVSILRERIANFEAPASEQSSGAEAKPEVSTSAIGISINDLRKNLSDINDHMDARMRIVRSPLRHHARRLPHHRHRSAAGSRVGAGGHQHGVQPGLLRHQPGPGLRRPEDRPIQTRRRNRNPEGPGRGRASYGHGHATGRTEEKRSGRSGRLSAQRAPQALQPSPPRHPGGEP